MAIQKDGLLAGLSWLFTTSVYRFSVQVVAVAQKL